MTQDRPRRLAAVWFADIVGYTDLSARDEDLALRVVRELQRIAKKHCQARGGRVVKLMGDAVLTVFDSVDGAVRAAVALRDEFLRSEEARAAEVSIRIGVHLGEVADAPDGDVYGDAVNVASRIERVAEPGQVAISQMAYFTIQQRASMEAELLGEYDLKGLPEPLRLYSVRLEEAEETSSLRELLQEAIAPLQLLDVEGMGGMGEIYLARDPGLRRTLAVKVLKSELAADSQARARFQREATVIAGLSHPNVITIHSVGELKDETPYFVMDYIEGGSLADRLEQEGPLSVPEARRILGEVASALQAAHAKGIVHRDIKAANVLWDLESGRALVTDWGIAALDPTVDLAPETRLTKTGVFIGSPQYMSPEQLAGDEVGPETDIYSLGLLAFELLSGHGPFPAETPREIMLSHLREDPPGLSATRDDVDPELESLTARCLSKTPSDRPSAAEMARLSPGAGTALEWPPPGLESLKGMSRWLAFWIGLACLSVTWPLIVAAFLEIPWGFGGIAGSSFRFGFPLFALSVLAALALVVVAGVTTGRTTYRLWKGLRLGYGWNTLLEDAGAWRGDAGYLITGAREYSVLDPAERKRLRFKRILFGIYLIGFALFAPLAAALLPLATTPGWWLVVGIFAVSVLPWDSLKAEPKTVKNARRRFRRTKESVSRLASLVESWRRVAEDEGMVDRGSNSGPKRWILPGGSVALGLVALVSFLSLGLLTFAVFLMSGSPGWAFPRMDRTLARWHAVAPFQDLCLPPDTSLTPLEAGRILTDMAWDASEPTEGSEHPAPAAIEGSFLVQKAGSVDGLRPDSLVYHAARGLTEAELAYLSAFAQDPRLPIFRRVARAAAFDWQTSNPIAPDAVMLPDTVPPWRVARDLASLNIARAAYLVGRGDLGGAEEALRENVSFGFLLSDGTDLLTLMIGVVIVEPALDAMAELYEFQGETVEADRLRSRSADPLVLPDSLSSSGQPALDSIAFFGRASDSRNRFARNAGDTTVVRGLRWTYLAHLVPGVLCTRADYLFNGPPEELHLFLADLRPTLVRFPSEEPLFDFLTQRVERLHEAMPDLREDVTRQARWMRMPSFLFRNPRLDACVALATRTVSPR